MKRAVIPAIVLIGCGLALGQAREDPKDVEIRQLRAMVTLQERHIEKLKAEIETLKAQLAGQANPTPPKSSAQPTFNVQSTTKPAAPPTEPLAKRLQQIMPRVELSSVTLENALQFVGDFLSANIKVDWPQLETAGVTRSTPIVLSLTQVPAKTALEAILRKAGGPVQLTYAYAPARNTLEISTKAFYDQLIKEDNQRLALQGKGPLAVVTKTYNVSDLLAAMQRTKPPIPGLTPSSRGLIEAISSAIDASGLGGTPEMGTVGEIWGSEGQLTIKHYNQVHELIVKLLAQMRAKYGVR